MHAFVPVIRLDENGDRYTGEDVRYGETDSPADYIDETDVDRNFELRCLKDIAVEDEDGCFHKTKADDGDAVEGEFCLVAW